MYPEREQVSPQEKVDYIAGAELNSHIPEWMRLEAAVDSGDTDSMYNKLIALSIKGMSQAVGDESIIDNSTENIHLISQTENEITCIQRRTSVACKIGQFIGEYRRTLQNHRPHSWVNLIGGFYPSHGRKYDN